MKPALIVIYHGTSPNYLARSWEPGDPIEAVYCYVTLHEPDGPAGDVAVMLRRIYRENNAVDGWELNVKAQERSLSVGDVVLIATAEQATAWACAPVGWSRRNPADLPLHPGLRLFVWDAKYHRVQLIR